jgi:choline dehydrogenase-like flavoprotein
MKNNEYDVVIVGSGPAGAIVAKTLVDAGKKVLVLEAGLQAGIALSGDEAYKTQQEYLKTFYSALAKTPNSPYPNLKNAPSSDVLDAVPVEKNPTFKGYLVQKGPLPFGSDNLVAGGGTTQHWLGTTLRMLPNDFKTKKLYGHGVDWPISYDDLRPYYEMAEYEIGVSGDVADQDLPNMGDNFFSKGYVFPMKKIPQSYMDEKMMKKTKGLVVTMGEKKYELVCCSTPQGRNSIPNKDYPVTGVEWNSETAKLQLKKRGKEDNTIYEPVGSLWDPYTGQRCEGNASCVPICPVQAKYNSLKTLKRAKQSNDDLLEIRAQSVAYDLIIDEQNPGTIQGIRYKRYESKDSGSYTTQEVKGKIYVLAASAIENAKLLLASNAANSSDQVGRNLMDHLCLLTWGTFPEKVYPFRGPGSTTNIATFRDGDFRKEHAPWICPIDNWGWGWPEFSPGTDVAEAVGKGKFGTELKKHLNELLTKQVLLHFECEQNPDPENRVMIDPKYKDQLDNYRPVIHYDASEYMKKAFEAAKKVSDQIFAANCIIDKTEYSKDEADYVEYNGKGYTFRGAGHIVGTHRMGSKKEDSVVDPNMRTWDHKNLYLVGAGVMPTLGTSNPTLTLSALSFKASEAILSQLQNIQA